MTEIVSLYGNIAEITPQMVIMWVIGGILIYLGIVRKMEPSLLVPMGFGAILVNLPNSGAVTQTLNGVLTEGPLDVLFNAGIANEIFLLLLFIGIGAMIDFTPLLANPQMMLFGAAAQFGIFFTISLATLFGFSLQDAASVGIIGAADGPTSIFVANYYHSNYLGAIIVAAYSYMALVPIIQPPAIRLVTTKKERRNYTLTVCGMLSLLYAVFPRGVRGTNLDTFARKALSFTEPFFTPLPYTSGNL